MKVPLVLLPGMMCDHRLFAPQITAFSGERAIHHAPLGDYDSVEKLAEQILENAPAKFALLGLSMGGIVAMEVIRQAPDRITKLALLDTNPGAELPEVSANREPQITSVKAGNLQAIMREEMKPNYLCEGPDKTDILDLCMEMAIHLGPEVFVRQSRALQNRPDQWDAIQTISVPTLIAVGQYDQLCPPERHVQMQKAINGSDLEIIEQAAHLPTLENPEQTNKVISRWLSQ